MRRVVFFDIDGTLLSQETGVVPASARRAVRRLRERGVRVVVATGRHPLELDGAGLQGMEFDGFAAANGQMCLDSDRRLFAGSPLAGTAAKAIVELFERRDLLLWLFGEHESYVNMASETLLAMAEQVGGLSPQVRPYDGMTVYQAVALVSEEDEDALAAQLPGCILQRWGSEGVDIIAADGGKVAGMRAFLERFGCTREACVAFGDQKNDLEMLRYAGVGVAMGNGVAAVKEAADLVAPTVDEDGVARVLGELGLLGDDWEADILGA